jgi:hypothetical protein
MKRLFIAAALLIAVSAACIWSLHKLDDGTETLLAALSEIETAQTKGNETAAQTLADAFPEKFRRETRQFPFFLYHRDVAAIEETASILPVLLKTGDTEHFFSELTRCRTQLQNLHDSERPVPENIL